jgi:uncharacterized membrane protein
MEPIGLVFGGFLSALMLIVSIVGVILILNMKSSDKDVQSSATEEG